MLSVLRRRRWLIAGILIAATVAAGYLLTGPAPPRQIRLATGQPGGMYDTFGAQYVARLGRVGLLRAGLAALDRVALEVQPLCDKVPSGRQHDVYNWRVHVAFVRSQALARLATLESGRVTPRADGEVWRGSLPPPS